MLKTISDDATSEVIEKKSRFIANMFYVESLEEAEEKIKQIKKKYYDARHNCFAFNIYNENGNISRFSDDGEPSGTAGIKYYFKQENIKMVDFNYAENVEITVEITEEKYQKILENIENLNFKILNVEKTKKAFIILSNNVE